jgi:hypothetical protein
MKLNFLKEALNKSAFFIHFDVTQILCIKQNECKPLYSIHGI